MSNINLKNLPKLRLSDLLKRKRKSLEQFVSEAGLDSYDSLVRRCSLIGVLPPTLDEYESLSNANTLANPISSPQDGIIVIQEETVEPVQQDIVETKKRKSKKTDDVFVEYVNEETQKEDV